MRLMHIATKILLSVVLLLMITTAAGIYSSSYVYKRSMILIDLYKLRSDILQANLALRSAAVLPVGYHQENELEKMRDTRNSANGIYDRLSAATLTHFEKTVVAEMKKERPEYRTAQMEVVVKIRKGESTTDMLEPLLYYQTLMDRYLGRVDTLIEGSFKHLKTATNNTVSAALGLFAIALLITAWILYRCYK